jgi:hypothetical protein
MNFIKEKFAAYCGACMKQFIKQGILLHGLEAIDVFFFLIKSELRFYYY